MSSHSLQQNNTTASPTSNGEGHPSEFLPQPDEAISEGCFQKPLNPAGAHDYSTLAYEDDDCVSIHIVLVDDVQDDVDKWLFVCADFEREELRDEPGTHQPKDFSLPPKTEIFGDVPWPEDAVSVVYNLHDAHDEAAAILHDESWVEEDVWLIREGSLEDL